MPKAAHIARAFLAIFCLWHAVAISVVQLPTSTAFGDLHKRFLWRYLALTGTWQRWGMFTARPLIQKFEVALRAYHEESETTPPTDLGPLFPNFQDIGDDIRAQYLYLFAVTVRTPFIDSYLNSACKRVPETLGWTPSSVALESTIDYTNLAAMPAGGDATTDHWSGEIQRVSCR